VLVLKRKIGESIMVGEDIEIVLLDRDGDTVKIGVEAPRSIRVFRKEIYEEIKQANHTALQTEASSLDMLRQMMKNREK
jgi:carbon storage regulator